MSENTIDKSVSADNTNTPSTSGETSTNNEVLRGVQFYQSQAYTAFKLSKLIYDDASEDELAAFGTPEERNVLLGLFAYQLMGIATVTGTSRATVFRALGINKLGFGKNMTASHQIATRQVARREAEREAEAAGAGQGVEVSQQNGVSNGTGEKDKSGTYRHTTGSGKGK